MLPPLSPQIAIDALANPSHRPLHENADYAHHLQMIAAPVAPRDGWLLRLLPAPLRRLLQRRIEAIRHERALIALWETSPHLLQDVGVILTHDADLPKHLTEAPARVIDHVAAIDPTQIVEAELRYPPRPAPPAEAPRAAEMIAFPRARVPA